jgi:hypothetical protein
LDCRFLPESALVNPAAAYADLSESEGNDSDKSSEHVCLQGYWEYLTHDSGDWRKV